MSTQALPTLQELVMQRVQGDAALAAAAPHCLPKVLFLDVLEQVLLEGCLEILEKMLLAWPFESLSLGFLMKTGNVKALKTALYGLDVVLAQKEHSSQPKLRVVDFRFVPGDPAEAELRSRSTYPLESPCKKGSIKRGGRVGAKPRLRIFVDLTDKYFVYFLWILTKWALQWKPLVRLYSEKLSVHVCFTYRTMRILQLNYVQELEMDIIWGREKTYDFFSRYLSRMSKLRVFWFSGLSPFTFTCRSWNQWFANKYSRHLRKLKKLQELVFNDVFFLCGKLHKMLCSKSPLSTLSLTDCPLRESDVRHLAQSRCTNQLQHLCLRGISMKAMSAEPLRDLLEKAADTLESLNLNCELTDAQVRVLLPALGRCSQLRTITFQYKTVSMSTLKDLLLHTSRLTLLREGLFSVPLESLENSSNRVQPMSHPEKFDEVLRELREFLSVIRPDFDILLKTFRCDDHFHMLWSKLHGNDLANSVITLPTLGEKTELAPWGSQWPSICQSVYWSGIVVSNIP